jgi:hypothetical protein
MVTDHSFVHCDRPDLCSMVGKCHHQHGYRDSCYQYEWEHVEEVACEKCLRLESMNAKLKLLLAQTNRTNRVLLAGGGRKR